MSGSQPNLKLAEGLDESVCAFLSESFKREIHRPSRLLRHSLHVRYGSGDASGLFGSDGIENGVCEDKEEMLRCDQFPA